MSIFTLEERKAIVSQLNMIDDIFFQKVMEDRGACEEALRVIMDNPDLEVIEVKTQFAIRQFVSRSVILDAFCRDSSGRYINIEMQKADDVDHFRRVRFYTACIDSNNFEKGKQFKKLPDVCVVYITRFDIFEENRTLYRVKRMTCESNRIIDDGSETIYVNTAVKDGTSVSDLMTLFEHSTESRDFPRISERIQHFKQKGAEEMEPTYWDKLTEQWKAEGKAEGLVEGLAHSIKSLMKNMNMSISSAMDALGISQSERPKYEALLNTL